ncbi:MAG: hypothetical protein PWQ41_39 [Bacillota bacterium]|jgi:hypothetical protein|nr:hypothetical protein [Bacillota bacterium]MDK2924265.1 hypothetical protein [Bacillota bacterium]
MGPILATAIQFFTEDDWKFARIEGKPILSLPCSGRNGNWQCWAEAREEQQQFIFYSVCPIKVPEGKRLAVAEYLTRANYGLVIGNFELDFNDGEVRYKTSIDVEGDELTPALVKNLVYANLSTMDRYLPGIMGVVYANLSPQQAIAQVED